MLKSLRVTTYPFKQDATADPYVLSQTGVPGKPFAWTDSSVSFKWSLSVPVTAAGAYVDFTTPYPDNVFSFSATPWLDLMSWRGGLPHNSTRAALAISEVWLAWGASVHSPNNLDVAGLKAQLSPFNDAKSANYDNDRFECNTVVSAGSSRLAKFIPKSTTEGVLLDGGGGVSDFCRLGLRLQNTGGSPSVSGLLSVIVLAREI